MKAIFSHPNADNGILEIAECPVPEVQQNDILIQIKAAGVNHLDLHQRAGHYPPPPGAPDILGVEASGVVVAMGSSVHRFKVGDQVMALLNGGGYAEYVTVPEQIALPIPETMDFIEAAGFPETCFTVWSNVFDRAKLQKGETLLVHGGSSGIGVMTIQLAKAFGATVLVTARSDEKCASCLKIGADHAINSQTHDFVAATKEFTQGKGVNVILDMVGGDYVTRNYEAAAFDGRIAQIAFLQNSRPTVNLALLTKKRLSHLGATLRARSDADKAHIAQNIEKHVLPLIREGKVRSIIDTVFPIHEAESAHQRMMQGGHTGKIILTLPFSS